MGSLELLQGGQQLRRLVSVHKVRYAVVHRAGEPAPRGHSGVMLAAGVQLLLLVSTGVGRVRALCVLCLCLW
jgi:hypothetical protein